MLAALQKGNIRPAFAALAREQRRSCRNWRCVTDCDVTYVADQPRNDIGKELFVTKTVLVHCQSGGSGRALFVNIFVEIVGKTSLCCGHPCIQSEVLCVGSIKVRQPKRPCAALRNRDAFNVKSGERAGRKCRVIEHVSVVDFLDGYDSL